MSTTISQEIVIITKMKKGKEKKISVAFFTIDRESTFLLFDSIIKGMKPICVILCAPKLIASASECVPKRTLYMNYTPKSNYASTNLITITYAKLNQQHNFLFPYQNNCAICQ